MTKNHVCFVLTGKRQGLWWSMWDSSISYTLLYMFGHFTGSPLNNKTYFCHVRCPKVDPGTTKQDTCEGQLWISSIRNSTKNRFILHCIFYCGLK